MSLQVVELTNKELQHFFIYKKNQKLFDILIDHNIHNMSNGNVILSFNPQGDIAKVKLEQVVYNK